MSDQPVGRCIGCFHDFRTGPCGGCGAVPGPYDAYLATGGEATPPRPQTPLPDGQVWAWVGRWEPRGTGLSLGPSCEVCGVVTAGSSRCIAHPAGSPVTRP